MNAVKGNANFILPRGMEIGKAMTIMAFWKKKNYMHQLGLTSSDQTGSAFSSEHYHNVDTLDLGDVCKSTVVYGSPSSIWGIQKKSVSNKYRPVSSVFSPGFR